MFALTLRHPWAYAIARLGKDVENREWPPPPEQLKDGDWFALHGGIPPAKGRRLNECLADLDRLKAAALAPDGLGVDEAVLPGVFAVAKFAGCVGASDSPWFAGPVGWTWSELVVLPEPVACWGAQKLWELPTGVLDEVRRRYRAVARA